MSTRRERANRWWLRCLNCGGWKARHYNPFAKAYTCTPAPAVPPTTERGGP